MAAEEQKAKRFGEFLVEKVICDGPQATVYKAKKNGTACALKILKADALPKNGSHRKKLAQLFRRLNMIDHPAVVKVIDGGERGGKLYIAMELMECQTLEELLKAEDALPEREVVMIGRRIAQALAAGEAVNICHGDVTLRNIFAPQRDEVKLADFAVKKYLKEMPSDAVVGRTAYAGVREGHHGEGGRSAEDVLRSRSMKDTHEGLKDDLAALGAVMLSLLGLSVPHRETSENLDSYCKRLRQEAISLVEPPYSVSAHTRNVIDRLLSPEQFKSAGQALAELASAVLLHRTRHAGARPSTGQAQALQEPEAAAPDSASGAQAPQVQGPAGAVEKAVEQVAEDATRPRVVLLWRGEDRGEFVVLSEGAQLVIGRDPYACDLVIEESAASRKHCTLTAKGNHLEMLDTNSYHGTYVNGVRVEHADLAVGDIVRIGTTKITIGASLPAR